MFKQILGKLPRKTSSKSPSHNDSNNEGAFSSVNSLNSVGGGVSNNSKNSSASGKALNSGLGAFRSSNGTHAPQSSSTTLKSNQGKKLGPMAAQAGQLLNYAAYEALPSFRDVPSSEKHNLFIKKLNMCCMVFDFSDASKNIKEKDIKRQTLLELVDYISSVTTKFNEVTMQEITKMIAENLFRALPSNHNNKLLDVYDPEDDEPTLEPSWPHLQIVYEFLLRFVASSETDAKLAKRYIDHSFLLRLLDLFDSEDQREREYLKTILHRIYGKFMVHRPFIRKAINNIFYNFIFETERHNGIAELLEILGSIINGFALPLKEEHKLFLVRALIPLHKPKSVSMYHQQLSYCITQFVEKDFKLADTVIRGLLKYWPITNSSKEVMFLSELEEVLETTQAAEFQRCMVPLFGQIGRCVNSSHFQKFILKLEIHDDRDKRKAMKTVSTLSGIDSISMNMKDKKLTVIGTVDPVNAVSKLRKFWKTDIVSVGPAKEPEKKEEPKKEEPKKEEPKKEETKEEAKKEETKEEPKKEEAKKEEPNKEEESKKEEVVKKIEPEPVVGVIMPPYRPYYAPMNTYYPPGPPVKGYYPPMNTNYNVHHSMEENPNACVIM